MTCLRGGAAARRTIPCRVFTLVRVHSDEGGKEDGQAVRALLAGHGYDPDDRSRVCGRCHHLGKVAAVVRPAKARPSLRRA
jgi:hypothetical protein